ncbi:hypothetical protein FRACYDRAFT_244748 [Fragilariopsis cylindrus CCMP1102]|uniref:Uncharacterized protein n=1 Tax=Fragilariopsis cylindrus CCMP1102 TaxID=635003 RepID=A0A1E7F037_9STRA|nr:hypothetical protein FRACYDRAFT_244748 [Fragilariopsis cylindrus CCMP1102]|eukprot:OEU11630.1 hypothetical protein FRACYDRAFT_244748 [Fragilariopsis cylindrus CCMP1102]
MGERKNERIRYILRSISQEEWVNGSSDLYYDLYLRGGVGEQTNERIQSILYILYLPSQKTTPNTQQATLQQEEKGDATTGSSDAAAAAADSSSCAWCPLGSTTGICLRTDQAELVNGGFENEDHLLHLQCYNNNIEQEQLHTEIATSTSFWDETMACHAHTSHSCAGHHGEDGGKNHHICTWCTVKEPEIGMCISQNLWDNLVVAQALEEFDNDVSTNDQIRIDEVIHCVGAGDTDIDIDIEIDEKTSLFDTSTSTCGSKLLSSSSASSLVKCLSAKDGVGGDGGGSESCVIQANPFPGLLGYVAGEYCMSQQQQRFILWIIELLRGLGWEKEMSSYAK